MKVLKRYIGIGVCCVLLLVSAGCDTRADVSTPGAPDSQPSADVRKANVHRVQYVWDALEAAGLEVHESTTIVDPGVFGEDAGFVTLAADEAFVRIFVPSGSLTTTDLASRIGSDGSSYRTAGGDVSVSWVGRPRFYQDANLIVLYLAGEQLVNGLPKVTPDTDRRVIDALEGLMGEPFAGGW